MTIKEEHQIFQIIINLYGNFKGVREEITDTILLLYLFKLINGFKR